MNTIASEHFGIEGRTTPLPGYVDANARLEAHDGRMYSLRVSPPGTNPALLDFIGSAMSACNNAALETPQIIPTLDGNTHATLEDGSLVRLLTWVEGTTYEDAGMPATAARSIGRTAAATVASLAAVEGSPPGEPSRWDLSCAADTITRLYGHLASDHERSLVSTVLERYESLDRARLPTQVIHNDINPGNLLLSDGEVVGLLDFGDSTRTFRIAELAIAAAYAALNKDDPVSVIAQVCVGYRELADVTEVESNAVFDLLLARLATSVTIASSHAAHNPHHHTTTSDTWDLLGRLLSADVRSVAEEVATAASGTPRKAVSTKPSRARLAPSLGLSYDQPITITSGRGAYLFDERGRRFLDCVNNVCHVGHANPTVVRAAARQMATLNTNTRYLHDALPRYADRITATLPDSLDTVVLVNSGSEANELAIRMARAATGRTDVVTVEDAYHGNTSTLIDVSPYKYAGPGGSGKKPWVHMLPTTNGYRSPHFSGENGAENYRAASEGVLGVTEPAALIIEALQGCGGQTMPDRGVLHAAYDAVRIRRGLVIADEVQTGFGRVGSTFWAFQLFGLVPDIVTMGKPAGNGHPLGVVVTTRTIAESFDNGMEYFNTFGGNTVSATVGNAVLDVIEQEQLQEHASSVGTLVMAGLSELASELEEIGDVRGSGLFIGVDLVRDRASREPHPRLAAGIVQDALADGVLISIDGPGHNVLKIKPPMVFNHHDAERLVDVIGRSIKQWRLRGRSSR